jgi:hypothetical protein
MMKKLSSMRKKKKDYFFTPNINEENEVGNLFDFYTIIIC